MMSFKIPIAPTSTPKTVRFPDELIEEVEKVIKKTNCTFSAFIVEATRNAIEELKIKKHKSKAKN
ncbi:MAG: hypothetical protein HFJ33_04280 [Clostridia bacterium]|nr:hypothetical protein [Clostridia bacterium]